MSAVINPPPLGRLPLTARMELLSRAYVDAVAASAGCTTSTRNADYDGVDVEIHQSANHLLSTDAHVGLQLKATSQDLVRKGHIAFPLDAALYDKLRDPRLYRSRILVVMLLPKGSSIGWLYQHPRAMLVRNCAYWVSLRGLPQVHTKSTTAHVPLAQPFNVSHLCAMLQRIGSGGDP